MPHKTPCTTASMLFRGAHSVMFHRGVNATSHITSPETFCTTFSKSHLTSYTMSYPTAQGIVHAMFCKMSRVPSYGTSPLTSSSTNCATGCCTTVRGASYWMNRETNYRALIITYGCLGGSFLFSVLLGANLGDMQFPVWNREHGTAFLANVRAVVYSRLWYSCCMASVV